MIKGIRYSVVYYVHYDFFKNSDDFYKVKQNTRKGLKVEDFLLEYILNVLEFFCFDQSTNHNAIAVDATRINSSLEGAQLKMHDGWYINEYGEKCV